jgi:hypothetical protein
VAVVVIGGQSRSVGKTSVVAGLIEALPAYQWMAFKVTQFGHGRCSRRGEPCHCAPADHRWGISEEHDRSARTDSSRFLAAGAKRSFWVRTRQGRLEEAMPAIEKLLSESENAILESNTIINYLRPDLYLTILDPATEDWKASALRLLKCADAIIVHRPDRTLSGRISLPPVSERPVFSVQPPEYVTDDIVRFVERRLRKETIEAS